MTGVPPPRYRVVERGRRLVVIDRLTGAEAGQSRGSRVEDTARNRLSLPGLPKQVSFDGSSELTTHALYDEKAPRTIRLDPGSAATIGRVKLVALVLAFAVVLIAIAQPAALAVLVVLGNTKMRRQLRARVTRWLDRVEAEAN